MGNCTSALPGGQMPANRRRPPAPSNGSATAPSTSSGGSPLPSPGALPPLTEAERAAISQAAPDFSSQYKFSAVVGRGQFGVVFMCTDRESSETRVAKLLQPSRGAPADIISQQINAELTLGKELRSSPHKNLMTLVDGYRGDKVGVMVYPYYSGGEVVVHLQERRGPTGFCGYGEEGVRIVAKGLLRAVAHLHDLDFCHMDIKPQNILLARRPTAEHPIQPSDIRLLDYGSVVRCPKGRAVLRQVAGTLHFCAPEVVRMLPPAQGGGAFDERCDVWSSAVLLYAMLLEGHPFVKRGEDPYHLPQSIFRSRVLGAHLQDSRRLGRTPHAAQSFFRSCLVADFRDRWNSQQALESDWIATAPERGAAVAPPTPATLVDCLSPRREHTQLFCEATANLRGLTAPTLCDLAARGELRQLRDLISEAGGVPPGINDGDYDRRTALHLAASEGHLDVVSYLAQLPGVSLNGEDRWGGTPLDDATRGGHATVADYLRRRGARPGRTGSQPLSCELCSAASRNDVAALRRLLSSTDGDRQQSLLLASTGDYDRRTPLHLAASEGHLEAAEFLCSVGVDVNAEDRWGGTPLADALRLRHSAVAQLLRSRGARAAGPRRHLGVVCMLCDHAAQGQLEEFRQLYETCLAADNPEEAVRLINKGDYDRRTPLHLAAAEGHLGVVQFILSLDGASVNPRDRWHGTPLGDALTGGHNAVAGFLSARGGRLSPHGPPRATLDPESPAIGEMANVSQSQSPTIRCPSISDHLLCESAGVTPEEASSDEE